MKEKIIQEIEAQSGFPFLQFQARMNNESYDALMVIKDVRGKFRRWITDDLLITELGFKKSAVNRSSTIREKDKTWMSNGMIKMPWLRG